MEKWFEGIFLLGRFNSLKTGCWLLVHNHEAAILELPPRELDEECPSELALEAVKSLNVSVKFILCTHNHGDHLSEETLSKMRALFPRASVYLQKGCQDVISSRWGIHWFKDELKLDLGGEPLYLVHAPKHSDTDTMIIFRGTICTGDWELGTIRSVHDGWSGITEVEKNASIDCLLEFVSKNHYHIHQTFSVHANDRKEQVDFIKLMEDTRVNRKLW